MFPILLLVTWTSQRVIFKNARCPPQTFYYLYQAYKELVFSTRKLGLGIACNRPLLSKTRLLTQHPNPSYSHTLWASSIQLAKLKSKKHIVKCFFFIWSYDYVRHNRYKSFEWRKINWRCKKIQILRFQYCTILDWKISIS